jgi:DNA-directed RNA polymerase subunit RPC12/RpoP
LPEENTAPVARLVRSGEAHEREFPCNSCGAKIRFDPAAGVLKCAYCGSTRAVPRSADEVAELDFHAVLARAAVAEETFEQVVYECESCGAETTAEGGEAAIECPYCGTPLVHRGGSTRHVKPKSLLPFKVSREKARALFAKWIRGLWFAPNALKRYAHHAQKLGGVYVPYWTYDCNTITWYTGERGEHYWFFNDTATTENGKTVRKSRQVRKTRWYSASGTVFNSFDDILVLASTSLPTKYVHRLEPWDLHNLVPYSDDYLSGFRAESYHVDLEAGFERATEVMAGPIHSSICRDIGGDEPRVHSQRTRYEDISFKHLLLPIWIRAYRFREKVYRFLVNARTGEVQGERPWSWVKITLAVLGALAVVGAIAGIFAAASG